MNMAGVTEFRVTIVLNLNSKVVCNSSFFFSQYQSHPLDLSQELSQMFNLNPLFYPSTWSVLAGCMERVCRGEPGATGG